MSERLLLVRVADRTGALERVLGLLRRKVLAVEALSLAGAEGVLEVALRVDEARTPCERLEAELLGLADVVDVRDDEPPTREMVIARLKVGSGPPPEDGWTVLSNGVDGAVVELTGSPQEVDAALARLRAAGTLAQVSRSGELALPQPDTATVPYPHPPERQ